MRKQGKKRGGRGRAETRITRAICSMQRQPGEDKEKEDRRREIPSVMQELSHLPQSVRENLANSVTLLRRMRILRENSVPFVVN
jgi:hypothetical protein